MDIEFPKEFVWGASTSSYQIEGAWNEDDKGRSIWDTFTQTTTKIKGNHTGNRACNHYHLYKNDVVLMKSLGLQAYRFSTAWTRLFPQGGGKANAKGRDFYDRLIDEIAASDIDPWLCFYHWDLPQVLQDKGGWQNRDTVYYFADYAAYVAEAYGDRVKHFIAINEANVATLLGHLMGIHAPGLTDLRASVSATHHFNLATGMTVERLRSMNATWQLGTILNLQPIHPEKDTDEDIEASLMFDAIQNKNFLNPLLKGRYPDLTSDMMSLELQNGDMEQIKQPLDFLGLNYFTRILIKADSSSLVGMSQAEPPKGAKVTDMDWEVHPDAFYEQLTQLKNDYGNPKLFITENGAAFPDELSPRGAVHDKQRISYLEQHLVSLKRALDEGANIAGYFVGSLMDNFEWSEGYTKRFGLTYIDYETQERIPKDSFKWYQNVIRENGFNQLEDQ